MIWHHVAKCAGLFVELAAALDSHRLRDGDLHLVDMVAIPDRLKEFVGETNGHDALDRLLAEEMVDPIDLLLVEDLQDPCVQGFGGFQTVPERLLDDDVPPALAPLLVKE